MDKPELKPCPFCGGLPEFTEVEEEDERRYMKMTLDCCVSMKATVGWGTYRHMTAEAIQTALETDLIERWNARA